MVVNISASLIRYEKDFVSFQKELPNLRKTKPNQFVAFKEGNIVCSGNSVEEVKEELISKGIEPSGTVIEFVSKEEIRMIVWFWDGDKNPFIKS